MQAALFLIGLFDVDDGGLLHRSSTTGTPYPQSFVNPMALTLTARPRPSLRSPTTTGPSPSHGIECRGCVAWASAPVPRVHK
eukprot:scaffold65565_cov66-Phaeocystis_antarctica.AAC.4